MLTGTSGRDHKGVVITFAALVDDPVADPARGRPCPQAGHPLWQVLVNQILGVGEQRHGALHDLRGLLVGIGGQRDPRRNPFVAAFRLSRAHPLEVREASWVSDPKEKARSRGGRNSGPTARTLQVP